MSTTTYFRPRPRTSHSTSPVRTSTTRSTVRAIPPSPPLSLSSALLLECACSAPPRKPILQQSLPLDDLQPFAHYVFDGRSKSVPVSPLPRSAIDLDRAIVNDDSSSTCDFNPECPSPFGSPSPLALEDRSCCPDPKQRESPTLHNENSATEDSRTSDEDENHDEEHDHGDEQGCPLTPTPMTRAQKQQAYEPMGISSPLPQHKGRPKDTLRNLHAQSKSAGEIMTGRAYAESIPSLPRTPPLPAYLQPSMPRSRPCKVSRAQSSESSSIDAPIPAHFTTHRPANSRASSSRHVPHRPTRSHRKISRHMSSGARSNDSAVTSRSVFSTPGRDEMERKKVSVEPDQGPFGRVLSIQELEAQRRNVAVKHRDEGLSTDGGNAVKVAKKKGSRCCTCFWKRWLKGLAFA
ncbi:hypothetical protein ACN47E_008779 [Coniothyrium glycines]